MDRKKEAEVANLMIQIYCRKKHKRKKDLCPYCNALSEYVDLRLKKCPHGDEKTFCASCKIHCYRQDMREQIRQVMRFSAPRMFLYHPIISIKHIKETKKNKKKL